MKNTIAMSALASITEQLELLEEKRAAIADLERKVFAADFAKSTQCEAIIEAHIMYLKHKLIPLTIKQKSTVPVVVPANLQRYCSPWIYDDINFKNIALEVVARELGRALGSEYKVDVDVSTQVFKISW